MATEEMCTTTTDTSGPGIISGSNSYGNKLVNGSCTIITNGGTEESSPAELPITEVVNSHLEVPYSSESSETQKTKNDHHNNNTSENTRERSPSPAPLSPCPSPVCTRCQKTETESQAMVAQLKSQFETDYNRLKKEVEMATKAKETIVMRYANSEMEVLKLKRDVENSDKQIKQLNREIELLHKKQTMLSTERERLTLMVDSKVQEIQGMQKHIDLLKEDISSKDFRIKWTQNKLTAECEAHKSTQERLESRIQEIEKELADIHSSQIQKTIEEDKAGEPKTEEDIDSRTEKNSDVVLSSTESSPVQSSTSTKELEVLKQKNKSLIEENNSLSYRVQSLEQERLDLEQKFARLQESNSEHLHQIASLQSDLAATESQKVHLQREQDLVITLQKECQSLRQAHSEALADMAVCRAKEAELLGYTQQVTEKNVALQSEFSSVESKSFVLEEENERLHHQIEHLENDLKNLEKMMSQESKNYLQEKQSVESDADRQKKLITELQLQLDEARGEIGLLNRKLNSSVRELSKELHSARKQVKDSHPGSDALSQSSRTSSSSSLANGDASIQSLKSKQDEISNHEKSNDQDCPVIPDQQILIERIVKLQRTLAKKQDKIEFLQEHVKQLVESIQKKSKIIQVYAMSQDVEALSSNISEQNKAEALKHGGIMASVYGSKPADDGLTLDLSLEINRKLQVVLEDTLLKNITLKDSLNTLGKEISKLTEINQDLRKQTVCNPE